jgi:acyltransferase
VRADDTLLGVAPTPAVREPRRLPEQPAPSQPGPERLVWVDVAKGIGIALVVLGHAPGLGDGTRTLIYAFHMPLFFLLSGLLASARGLEAPFPAYAAEQARRLLVPYFAFSLLSYPIWWLAVSFGKQPSPGVTLARPLLGTLYGNGTDGWLDHDVALWFYPCLFSTRLLFFWVARLRTTRAIAVALLALAIAGPLDSRYDPIRWPWGLNVALVSGVFFGAGFLLRRLRVRAPGPGDPRLLALMAVGLPVQLGLTLLNGRVDMNGHAYGSPWLFYAAATSGIAMTCALARYLERARLPAHLGRNSNAIFPLHIPLFTLFTGVAVLVAGLPQTFNDHSSALGVLYAVAALALLAPAGDWLRRYVPWLIGERPRGAPRLADRENPRLERGHPG